MNAIVRRATIDEIVANRARALQLYAEAWDTIETAASAAAAAVQGAAVHHLPRIALAGKQWKCTREEYLAEARANIDRAVWNHLLLATGLERLMDRQARDQFRAQLEKDPPEVTAENCLATMEKLAGERDLIFKRGIANAFSGLDRRFRSHDGFKIGSRVVLSSALSDCGMWNQYRRQDEVLRDVERTFCLLDGKPQPERHAGIVGAIEAERRKLGWGLNAFEAENEYFRFRGFKNCNAHLWFKRDDLVEKVNLLLAEYYGAALGAGSDAAERTHAPSGRMARALGFFASPARVVERVIEEARIGEGVAVLEPSAGDGALAKAARASGANVTCVEIDGGRMAGLTRDGFKAYHADFLVCTPSWFGPFDAVVMNPPFDRGLDVEHVTHALKFLKPGGRLVSVMAAGVEFREDRRTADFRAMIERFDGRFYDLPPGSFAEAGTMVNTVICSVRAP